MDQPATRKPDPGDIFTERAKAMILQVLRDHDPEAPGMRDAVGVFLKACQKDGLTWGQVFLLGCEITSFGAENSFEIPVKKWEVN